MGNERDRPTKRNKKKSLVIALPQLPSIKNKCESDETWALLWKRKIDQRETIVLICLLSTESDRHISDYRKTVDKIKLEAKESGCASVCLTNMLCIVKIRGDYRDQEFWWHQFFDNDPLSDDTNQYQVMYFENGHLFSTNVKKKCDEWSLLVHIMNNSKTIEEIVRNGRVPRSTYNHATKPLPKDASATNNVTIIDDECEIGQSKRRSFSIFLSVWVQKSISNNSITILHLHYLKSMRLSSIAMVRSAQAFLALRNGLLDTNRTSSFFSNSFYNHSLKPNLIPSQLELSKERVARWNTFFSALFDMFFGVVAGAVLLFVFYNEQSFAKALNLNSKLRAFQHLEDHIAWLETFPAGFKLNVQLTHTMGHGIRSFLNHHKYFLSSIIQEPLIFQIYVLPTLATIAALGGWTTFLALLVDLWRLEILHVTLLAICFRKLYQAELYLLSALFRLFRGKKRNVLRQRTDSMKYDAMQLLVGTIAFCVCVFLWTTVMVYYTFFVIWNLLMHLPLLGFSVLYLLSQSIPLGSMMFRISNPHWFPKDLYLEMNDELRMNSKQRIQISKIKSTLDSLGNIFISDIKVPLKRLLNWYLISFLEVLHPRASHKSHSFLPLTLLVENAKK